MENSRDLLKVKNAILIAIEGTGVAHKKKVGKKANKLAKEIVKLMKKEKIAEVKPESVPAILKGKNANERKMAASVKPPVKARAPRTKITPKVAEKKGGLKKATTIKKTTSRPIRATRKTKTA
jgi:hypothetical protein